MLDEPEWKEFFDKHEATGTILIVDSRSRKRLVFMKDALGSAILNFHVSKVPHTLFALDAGVVKDEFPGISLDG